MAKDRPAPWQCVVTEVDVDRAALPGSIESLPLVGRIETNEGPRLLWELPSAMVELDQPTLAEESVTVLLRRRRGPQSKVAATLQGVARRSRAARDDGEPAQAADGVLDWAPIADEIESLVDAHVDGITEILGTPPPDDSASWGRGAGRRVIRPLAEALVAWRRAGRGDEPRLALIVRLAQDLRRSLPDVCARPRVVLSRDRQLRSVHRIEQIDGACLRWLARQPGWTVLEKAGSRQQVLSVVRLERADTLENRVVRDLLTRAARAGDAYLRQHRRFAGHARCELVRGFTVTVRSLLRTSAIGSVSPLVGVPAPNYVLLHDARYRPLWEAYLRLVRHQQLLDSAWKWQRRIWVEACLLALLATFGAEVVFPCRADLDIGSEHSSGRFISRGTSFPPVQLPGGRWVDVVVGHEQIGQHPSPAVRGCMSLCPDFVLLGRRSGRDAVVCVWCMTGSACALPVMPQGVRGVVLVPRLHGLPVDRSAHSTGVSWLEIPLPIQDHRASLADMLGVVLGSAS